MMNLAAVEKFINDRGILAEVHRHPQEDGLTSQQAAAAHRVPVEQIVKTLIFVGKKGNKAAVIIQGHRQVDIKKIPGLKKPRLARPEELAEWLGAIPGGVAPIALPDDLPKFVDEGVTKLASVIGSAGDRFAGVKLSPKYIIDQPQTTVLNLVKD